MSEHYITVVRRLFKGFLLESNLEQYGGYFTPDVLIHGPATGQKMRGLDTSRRLDEGHARAFDRVDVKIEDIFAQDERVVVNWTTQFSYKQGECEGGKAPQKDAEVFGITIYRFRSGKICEVWQSWDRLGLMEQIAEVGTVSPVNQAQRERLLSVKLAEYSDQVSRLSKRERECLDALLDRKTAKQTAESLGLSRRTVESYYENIKDKLGCENKKEVLATAQILARLDLL